MRPRFSLKWLLIAFTISGVAFYFCFVRPTALASRLVSLVEHDDLQAAESLFVTPDQPFDLEAKEKVPVIVKAELLPRSWHDVLTMQRRLDFDVIPTQPNEATWARFCTGIHFQATSSILGIRGSEKYYVSYSVDQLDR